METNQETENPGEPKINTSTLVQEPVKYLKEDAIYYYNKPLKSRGKVPPPTPSYDIDYTREKPLPEIDVNKIDEVPVVSTEGIKFTIENLGEKLGFDYYEYSLIQFWFLDILTDCVWKCQEVFHFEQEQQKVVLVWVSTFFKIIADPSLNISRKNFLQLFKEVLLGMYKEISKSCDFPSVDFISDIMQKQQDDTAELDTESSSSDSSGQPTLSTFTMKSKDQIKINPEFDIREHIRQLKNNNPLANAYHNYTEPCASSNIEDVGGEEEEEYTLYKGSEISFDYRSFYQPDTRTPAAFRSSQSGMTGIIPACRCKLRDYILDYLDGGEYHDDYYDLFKFDSSDQRKPSKSAEDEQLISEIKIMSASSRVLNYLTRNDLEMIVDNKSPVDNTSEKLVEDVEEHELMPEDLEKQEEDEILNEWAYFKLMEQRGWNMDDPRVGWMPWLSTLEKEKQELVVEELVEEEASSGTSSTIPDECSTMRSLHFNMLKAIMDFVFEYFYENFHFTLIKLAFRSTPTTITQKLNEKWNVPKVIKQELKKPKPTKKKKEKKKKDKSSKKSKKSTKSKSDKKKKKSSKKSSKSSKKSKGSKKDKKKALTKEEKEELERLRLLAQEEEAEKRRQAENKIFMFPLADAASEDLFMNIFENWVKKAVTTKKDKKGKKGKKGKK